MIVNASGCRFNARPDFLQPLDVGKLYMMACSRHDELRRRQAPLEKTSPNRLPQAIVLGNARLIPVTLTISASPAPIILHTGLHASNLFQVLLEPLMCMENEHACVTAVMRGNLTQYVISKANCLLMHGSLSAGYDSMHNYAFLGPSGRIGTASDFVYAFVPHGPKKQLDLVFHAISCHQRGLSAVCCSPV